MKLPTDLPPLSGRWLSAYRLLWWLVFLVSLAGATAGSWLAHRNSDLDAAYYRLGLRSVPTATQDVRFAPLAESTRQAGVVFGDVLLAVDGIEAGTSRLEGRINRLLPGPEGSAVTLRLRSPEGRVRDVVLVRSERLLREADASAPLPFATRNLLYSLITWLAKASTILVAFLLFRRRPGDAVAALLSLGLLMMAASMGMGVVGVAWAVQAGAWLGSAGLACVLVGLAAFPDGRFAPRWSLLVPALIVVATIARLVAPALGVRGMVGPLVVVVLILAMGLRFRRLPPGPPRQQMKTLLFGVVVCVLLLTASDFIRGIISRSQDADTYFWLVLAWRLVGALGIIAFSVSLLVSLLRYRLYDADAVIGRSAAYAGVTVAMVGIFAASEKLLELLGQQYFPGSLGAVSGAVAAAVAAALFTPVHSRLDAWTDRWFQPALTRMRTRLPRMLEDLRDGASLAELGDTVLTQVDAAVVATRSALLVGDGSSPMVAAQRGGPAADVSEWLARTPAPIAAIDKHDACFPIRLALAPEGGDPVGWLLLGPRPDGTVHGRDDQEALRELASPIARAIVVVRRNELRAVALDARLHMLESALARLQAGEPR